MKNAATWSSEFHHFLNRCVERDVYARATSEELLDVRVATAQSAAPVHPLLTRFVFRSDCVQHPWLKQACSPEELVPAIVEAKKHRDGGLCVLF